MGSMGSSDSKDPTTYLKVSQQCQTHRVFTDSQGKQYDKYLLYIDRSSNEASLYQHRKKNRLDNVVDVYFSDYRECIFGCQQISQNYQVVTQHLSLRLHQIEKLNFLAAINLLRKSIEGFNAIYKQNGPFQVTTQMIGVNSNKQVKVWLSKDLWKNTLDNTNLKYSVQSNNKKEAKMVNSIINVVNMKAQQCIQWNNLISFIRNNVNLLNFIDCLACIQRYCVQIHYDQYNKILSSSINKNIGRQVQLLQMKNSKSCKYLQTINAQEKNRGISSSENKNKLWKANQFNSNIDFLKSPSTVGHVYLSNVPRTFAVRPSPFHYNSYKVNQNQSKAIYFSNECRSKKLHSMGGLSKNLIRQRTNPNLNQNNSICLKIAQNYQNPHQQSLKCLNLRNGLDQVKRQASNQCQISDKNVFNQLQRVNSQIREITNFNENNSDTKQQNADKIQKMTNQIRKIGKENNESNNNYQEKRFSNNFKDYNTQKQFQNYWKKEISIYQENKEKEKLQDQQEVKEHRQQEICQEQAILRNPYINI